MKPLLAMIAVLVISGITASCSSSPDNPTPNETTPTVAPSPSDAASGAYSGGSGIPSPTPKPTAAPVTEIAPNADTQATTESGDETPDDFLPEFKDFTFNSYPLQNIRPRTVEITVETHRTYSVRAHNKAAIEQAVRQGLEASLKRCNIHVVSRAANKINFDVKDCRNMPDSAECVAIDATFRSPKFELEVGGYSHNGYTTKDGQKSRIAGDLTRAYYGAINAVMERLNKQLDIVGANQ